MSTIKAGDFLAEEIIKKGEQPSYNFSNQGHTLLIVEHSPGAEKIACIEGGTIELAVYVDGPVLFLLYRFDFDNQAEWDGAPFSWHTNPYGQRVELVENIVNPFEYIFRIVLAEAASGIVTVVREITLDESFALKLHSIILRQSKSMFNAQSFGKHLNLVYNEKTPSEMAELAEAYIKK